MQGTPRVLRFTTLALALVSVACAAPAPPEPEREFASAFEPNPGATALPYPVEFGPRPSVPQGRVYVGNYVLNDARVGFVRSCRLEARGAHFEVGRFRMMAFEVTRRAYRACVLARQCPDLPAPSTPNLDLPRDPNPIPVDSPTRENEPVSVPAESAALFCRVYGGDLPTLGQWHAAAHATDGRIGLQWVTDRLPRCFIDDRDPQCQAFQEAADSRPQMRDGEGLFPLRNVGATPWDVSPEGVFDLYGNAFEWLRDPSRELPFVDSCEGPSHSEADYYRGPPAPRPVGRGPSGAAPVLGINYLWLTWSDALPPERVLPAVVAPFALAGPTPPTEEHYYRNGFRCVFPENSP